MLRAFIGRASLRTRAALVASVVVVSAAVILPWLATPPICGNNEAAEALVVQQMVEHGTLLFPVLNAQAPIYKPPLFHWTATAIADVLGTREVTEWTVRLPSALYALAGIVLVLAFVARWLGLADGLLAALLLLTSVQYVQQGRYGRVDMTLAFWETVAVFSFAWWLAARDAATIAAPRSSRMTTAHYACAVALALGVLAKGPVGLILPVAAALTFLLMQRRWSDLRAFCRVGPVLVVLALSSAWYLACVAGRHVDIIDRQLGSENFGRFFGALGAMPPWYYVWPLLVASVPLGVLVLPALTAALRLRSRPGAARPGDRPATPVILAVFWCVTVLFFSIAAYKRRTYLLPLLPTSSVLVVWWLGACASKRRRHLRRGIVIAACALLVLLNPLCQSLRSDTTCDGVPYRDAAAVLDRITGDEHPLYSYGIELRTISPLLFYLDRTVPALADVDDVPPGYVLVPAGAWVEDRNTDRLHSVMRLAAGPDQFAVLESRPAGHPDGLAANRDETAGRVLAFKH